MTPDSHDPDKLRCAGCNRVIEVGDRYIEDAASGFLASFRSPAGPEHDDLIAQVLGGANGKIVYCENCTEPGGDYLLATSYGDDADA